MDPFIFLLKFAGKTVFNIISVFSFLVNIGLPVFPFPDGKATISSYLDGYGKLRLRDIDFFPIV